MSIDDSKFVAFINIQLSGAILEQGSALIFLVLLSIYWSGSTLRVILFEIT